MSDDNIGYVPHRISMKQAKLWKATSEIARMRAEMSKRTVIEQKKRGSIHEAKEILSGVAMPWRNK